MSTTPYEREILTHFYTTLAPFPREDAPLFLEVVEKFIDCGLLYRENGEIVGSGDALGVYMDALSAVPLPVKITEWRCV